LARPFEKALTTETKFLKEDVSSFRVIHKVTLGTLIFLVQGEPDACKYGNDVLDGIECSGWMAPPVFPTVEIMRSGAVVKRSMVELKTKSEKSVANIDWAAYYFQMLFGGISTLVLGIHNGGIFSSEPQEFSLDEVQSRAKPDYIEKHLTKLEVLLCRIRKVMMDNGLHQSAIFCNGKGGPIVIKPREGEPRVLWM